VRTIGTGAGGNLLGSVFNLWRDGLCRCKFMLSLGVMDGLTAMSKMTAKAK
jgi:hypothetical protein